MQIILLCRFHTLVNTSTQLLILRVDSILQMSPHQLLFSHRVAMVWDDTAMCATTVCAAAAAVYHMVNRHQFLTHDYSCGLDTLSMFESLCHRIHTHIDAGNVLSDVCISLHQM